MTGLFGGSFNPPHNGHVALAEAAARHFRLEALVVLVSVRPGHKEVQLDAETRRRLAEAAFPDYEVELDPHERTVDLLKSGRWSDPLFLIGADEFADFLTWKDPNGVVARARLGVATRPGYPLERLDPILTRLDQPDRVELFEIEPLPISSREIRDRAARGEPIGDVVPAAVAELIESLGLYRAPGYTSAGTGEA
ncbi:MAG TPA: nicotinate-nucleotide adenylyltransferase [Gaiellaceae bacterium]